MIKLNILMAMKMVRKILLSTMVGIMLLVIACTPVLPAADNQISDIVDETPVLPASNNQVTDITDGISADANLVPLSNHSDKMDMYAATIVNGCNTFSCDLYQQFTQSMADENFIYSPYSIYLALAMIYDGARGDTARQMEDTLHFRLGDEQVPPAFYKLNGIIEQDQILFSDSSIKELLLFQLNIANDLWVQKGYVFSPEYTCLVETYYRGDLQSLDFNNSSETSRREINDCISEKTKGKITEMLSPGRFDKYTKSIITNAMYFSSKWNHPFSKSKTQNDFFYLPDNREVLVPFMNGKSVLPYAEGDNYQIIKKYYYGNKLSMIIILPEEDSFNLVNDFFDYTQFKTMITDLEYTLVTLSLPRFKYDSLFDMYQTLAQLGISKAFSQDADFSGITENKEFYLNNIIHKTFIEVDEKGTNAAGNRRAFMVGGPGYRKLATFVANRPFIYFIQHEDTGAILFVGRVMNPAAE